MFGPCSLKMWYANLNCLTSVLFSQSSEFVVGIVVGITFFTVSRVFIIFFIVRTSKPYIDVDHMYHVWIRLLNYMFMLIFVNIFVNFFSSEYWIYSLFLYIFLSESAFSVTILPKYLKPSFYFIICP